MVSEARISLLARVARAQPATADEGKTSILSLAGAAYGARPSDEATAPTGFDPHACALFEAIVEGAYLVASADGVVDDAERDAFERVVAVACGGTVSRKQIAGLVSDLADQLAEDGLERRIAAVAENVAKREHGREVLRVACLLARASEDVSATERGVLARLAAGLGLGEADVLAAEEDVKKALAAG